MCETGHRTRGAIYDLSVEVKEIENGYVVLKWELPASIKVEKNCCVWKLAYKYPHNEKFQTMIVSQTIGFGHKRGRRIKVNRSAFDYMLRIYVYPFNEDTQKRAVAHRYRCPIKTIIIPSEAKERKWSIDVVSFIPTIIHFVRLCTILLLKKKVTYYL